jgi:hypothetical protein
MTELSRILAELDKVAKGACAPLPTEGREFAKKYCKDHPPAFGKPPFMNRTRTVGGEFSPASYLQPKQFKSEWDRDRCQAPTRTYPSRKGAVSLFYNPLGKMDWRPASTSSRELSPILHVD